MAAGFPCTDLSQAGRTAGIRGDQSGLVEHLFRLLGTASPRWVVIENVRNMLVLDRGHAMDYLVGELERLGYRWAYRLVDSRFAGVPQRRQRVIMVASKTEDPAAVLFGEDIGEPDQSMYRDDAYGFYWTEGLRGLGWAADAVPTLKGGSTIGIASPPAMWIRDAEPGKAIVTPGIHAAELLQGFEADWTLPAVSVAKRVGVRWKLIGNAVTVGVSAWLGRRLTNPGKVVGEASRLSPGGSWPTAAHGSKGHRWAVPASMWPEQCTYKHLLEVVDLKEATPLSRRATEGFHSRMERSGLRFDEGFKLAVKQHLEVVRASHE